MSASTPAPKKGGILPIILGVVLAGLGIYTFSLHREKVKNEQELSSQKEQLIKELSSLRDDYNQTQENAALTQEELATAQGKITAYIDSLKKMKVDIKALWKYRKQVQQLQEERKKLLAINDSLRRFNKRILAERDSTNIALNQKLQLLDSLSSKNEEMSRMIEEGAILTLKKLAATPLKEKSSGKAVEATRARATDKIRVCFTVASNRIAENGGRTFYIQVTNPLNVTLGKNALITEGDRTINYSIASKFIYEKQNIDICEFIVSKEKSYESGVYVVKIFDDNLIEIGSVELSLK